MTAGQKLIAARINLDLADNKMPPDTARFKKNLTNYPTSNTDKSLEGQNTGVDKPLQSNQLYYDFVKPEGENEPIGTYPSKDTNEDFIWYWNSIGNHFIARVNGASQTIDIVYNKPYLDFQYKPEYFAHEGGTWAEILYVADPVTNEKRRRTLLYWTTGYGVQGSVCVEDSFATNSFNRDLFPYFQGNYDEAVLIRWGVPTPLDCIKITEVENDDVTIPNQLRYNTWQFRAMFIDVYGRPSEHGIISDLYIPGGGDCLSASDFLSRCVDLTIKLGNPLIDQVQIEFRNCNEQVWYRDNVINLYVGSPLGDWWLRPRNPDVIYNAPTNEITYRFCKNKDVIAIATEETNRTENPLPLTSQALAKVGNTMALGNNKYGFPPFSKEAMDGVKVEVVTGDADTNDTGLRSIDIFFKIYAPLSNSEQYIWDLNGTKVFGGSSNRKILGRRLYRNEIASGYEQYFDGDQTGFIVYLAGTGTPPISAISEQYYLNDDGEFLKLDTYEGFDYDKDYYQRVQFFNLPPANYVVRMASHRTTVDNKDFDKTSTYLAGTWQFNGATKEVDYQQNISYAKELIVNVCEKDYSTLDDGKIMVVHDLTTPSGEETQSADGYIFEKKVDELNQIPIELLRTGGPRPARSTESRFTDHNGFYYFASLDDNFSIDFYGFCECLNTRLIHDEVGKLNRIYHKTYTLTPATVSDNNLDGSIDCEEYGNLECSRVLVQGRVGIGNVGVEGVSVILSRGGVATTDSNGMFTIVAHDDALAALSNQDRIDKIYIFSNKCNISNSDGECIQPVDVTITRCVDCEKRVLTIDSIQISFNDKKGLLSGGNYGVGIIGHDWLGRHGYVQTKDDMYKIMPSIIELKSLTPSSLQVILPANIVFDSWVDRITFAITKELTYADYISWVIDKVEFIDNSGNENKIAPTQIKLYYGSLNEYNKQNNFNTTTGWQFLYQNESNVNVNYTSDEVEFYINGDGKFFDKLIKAVVKYDQDGQYFLIDYDSALAELKPFGLVRLVRPKANANRNLFYELCVSVKVTNGIPETHTILLPAFDTYYINRQIPIPTTTGTGDDEVTANLIRSFGFDFEHHSVSDLWGDHCINIGRFFTTNPYEGVIYKPNEIALSGAISINGRLNYLHYFDEAKKFTVKIADNSGITALFFETGIVLVITGFDNCTLGYNDNLLRANAAGNVSAQSADALFGNPERKIGNNYGCQLPDKNSIRKRNGVVTFVDMSRAELVQSNFSDIASYTKGQCDGWFRSKVKSILKEGRKRYFHGNINPITNQYYLTDFDMVNKSYINALRQENPDVTETVSFNMATREMNEFLGFTPSYFAYLDSDVLNVQLFSIKDGNVYSHYNTEGTASVNTFYGTEVEKVIRQVVVLDEFKKKRPMWIEVYCQSENYFSDQVLTDSKQRSRILLSSWDKADYFYSANFKCDLNTNADPNLKVETGVNKILDGDPLYGCIVDVRLIGEPLNKNVYTELTGIIVHLYGQSPTSNDAG